MVLIHLECTFGGENAKMEIKRIKKNPEREQKI